VQAFALRSTTPACRVELTQGELLDTRFALRFRAKNGGVSGRFSKATLPFRQPVFVEGLNDNWPAGIFYRGKHVLQTPVWTMDAMHRRSAKRERRTLENALFRCSVEEGVGMLQVDVSAADRDVFIGNLLVCDQPEVRLELVRWEPNRIVVDANSPTDTALTVTVRGAPGFDLLSDFTRTLDLPPGGAVRIRRGTETSVTDLCKVAESP